MDQVPRKQESAFILLKLASSSLKEYRSREEGDGFSSTHVCMQTGRGTRTSSPMVALLGQAAGLTHLVDAKAKHRTTQKVGCRSKV